MSVKIYVRDNTNGNIHEYGTNQHDALILQDDGSLHYRNLQNGCGTMFPDEGYTFCEADGSYPRTRKNYIQYGVEPYIDIGGNGEDHTCVTCEWISVEDRLPEKNQAVLGWYKDNPFAGYTYGVVSWNGKGWVFVYAQRYVTNVTHWMPLPKAPETKKTKEE